MFKQKQKNREEEKRKQKHSLLHWRFFVWIRKCIQIDIFVSRVQVHGTKLSQLSTVGAMFVVARVHECNICTYNPTYMQFCTSYMNTIEIIVMRLYEAFVSFHSSIQMVFTNFHVDVFSRNEKKQR